MATRSDRIAQRAEKRELERRAEIEKGTEEIRNMFSTQFTPEFYDMIRSNFTDFYGGQLNEQYQDQSSTLKAALMRNGLFGRSSEQGKREKDLEEQYEENIAQLGDRAAQEVAQRQESVQRAQENVLFQLQSTADASGAAADAADYASIASTRPAYDPLGQVFTDASFGLATQADLERQGQSRYNTGLFPPRNSGYSPSGGSNSSGSTIN